MAEKNNITFEEAMEKLEQIVERLEEGDVPLEESIELFQQGMALSKVCHSKLQNIEKKMDTIMKDNGDAAPFIIQEEDQ
ncbi:exodeoxyribonuclease VII small subunit [Fictibacillus sp. KIGAM418]|uniref:Exodeoxyribonuclease 7 small subunit n=1 Tax=Fictibacillus marinisediminis TaxID=2878389 RepID=A0A9X1XBE7_9BACL|nr:exodeoxyribonuclease VII small subunit [Fictibacillus marinisediminis]MCK6257646.1 exodeoxyribonuclease VII small subunit [Fictibacillus marinisediminis]